MLIDRRPPVFSAPTKDRRWSVAVSEPFASSKAPTLHSLCRRYPWNRLATTGSDQNRCREWLLSRPNEAIARNPARRPDRDSRDSTADLRKRALPAAPQPSA